MNARHKVPPRWGWGLFGGLARYKHVAPLALLPPFLLAALAVLAAQAAELKWAPAQGPLATRWAKQVDPRNAWPEYPRPQLVRTEWRNLNGLWDYAIRPKEEGPPAIFDGQILVPFPVESALSGVMKSVGESNRVWYRKSFELPRSWRNKRLLLHFGAADWETMVYVNGKEVGSHRGGYDAFSFDITEALRRLGPQELLVSVSDPTDAGTQPRGKQVRKPHSIWYTPTSGIWQTVWIEPVPVQAIADLQLLPQIDRGVLQISVLTSNRAKGPRERSQSLTRPGPDAFPPGGHGREPYTVQVRAYDGAQMVAELTGPADQPFVLPLPHAKLWSPETPFLYDLKVTLLKKRRPVDQVSSYFGMRKVSLAKDSNGALRICLNNAPYFHLGPLDQGFWPDGLYAPPSDAALRYDIEVLKKLGYNMARKHVKVEPERWYYWCDKLGLLVWQDMPSGDRYIGAKDPDIVRSAESVSQFYSELEQLIDTHRNHPSIIMWVPFNEGWGQFDTPRVADWIKRHDPSRLVDSASGWTDRRVGDVNDIHVYPGPGAPASETNRAGVLGEFGGLGLPLSGHTWQAEKNWGYKTYKTREELTDAYLGLIEKMKPMVSGQGLSAAVYTQTTDVEIEVNGLMTYDREVIKMDAARVAEANRQLISTAPR